jgi:hypothetical protein
MSWSALRHNSAVILSELQRDLEILMRSILATSALQSSQHGENV